MSHRKEIKFNDSRQQVTARFFEENLPTQVKLMTYDEFDAAAAPLKKRHKDQKSLDKAIDALLKKAREQLREQLLVQVEKKAADAAAAQDHSEISCGDAHEKFVQDGRAEGLVEDTLKNRRSIIPRCLEVLKIGKKRPASSIPHDIDSELLIRLRENEGLKPSTIAQYHNYWHVFLEFLIENKYTSVTKFKKLDAPKAPSVSKSLTPEEAEKLVDAAESLDEVLSKFHTRRKHVARVIMMLRYTGMRVHELFHLKLSDIFMEGRARMPDPHVLVGTTVRTKTGLAADSRQVSDKGTVRSIAAPRIFAFLEKDLKTRGPNEVYFLDNGYGSRAYTSKSSITLAVRKCMHKLDIHGVQPCHAFRHTVAIELHENGADLAIVQNFLGHAKPETTASRYFNTERVQRQLGGAAQLLK